LTDHRKEGEPNQNPWGIFVETQAALISLVLTGGFSVRAGVEAPVFQDYEDYITSRGQDSKKATKKEPAKAPKEKKAEKKIKKDEKKK
jgi:hypothetical protein